MLATQEPEKPPGKPPIVPALLNATEAAAYLRVSRAYLHKLVRLRRLRRIVLGPRKVRFSRRELDRWIMTNEKYAKG